MPPAPGWRKCTAYRQPGAGGMPLALPLSEGLGVTLWDAPMERDRSENGERAGRWPSKIAAPPSEGEPMTSEEAADFVRAFEAAWKARDGAQFLALWHEEGVPPRVRIVVASIEPRTRGRRRRMTVARYGQAFKDRAVARLLAPESATLEVVAREVGIGVDALQRWLDAARSTPARGRAWSAGARLDAVIVTAALAEAGKSAWCRQQSLYPAELDKWRASAVAALAEPEEARASPQATRADRLRIKELERELLRKDRALAETAALLVLSKKVTAIFNKGGAE